MGGFDVVAGLSQFGGWACALTSQLWFRFWRLLVADLSSVVGWTCTSLQGSNVLAAWRQPPRSSPALRLPALAQCPQRCLSALFPQQSLLTQCALPARPGPLTGSCLPRVWWRRRLARSGCALQLPDVIQLPDVTHAAVMAGLAGGWEGGWRQACALRWHEWLACCCQVAWLLQPRGLHSGWLALCAPAQTPAQMCSAAHVNMALPHCPAYPAALLTAPLPRLTRTAHCPAAPPYRSLHMRRWASLFARSWTWRRCWRALVRAA